jgi:hypothetical protein
VTVFNERFQSYRAKYPAAAALFDKGVGICTELRLKEIELDSNRSLNDFGKREQSAKAAHENAIRLNGHRVTVEALSAANKGAKGRLRSDVFSPDKMTMPPEWRVEAFRHVDAAGGDGSKLMAENPDLLGVVYNAPIPLSRVPRSEVVRLADARVAVVRPAESAHIESEAEALSIVGAQLEIAATAIRNASGHGSNIGQFEIWLAAPERQPSAETQKQLSSEIAKVESAAILRSAATWDEADRKKLWDDLLDVRAANI